MPLPIGEGQSRFLTQTPLKGFDLLRTLQKTTLIEVIAHGTLDLPLETRLELRLRNPPTRRRRLIGNYHRCKHPQKNCHGNLDGFQEQKTRRAP